MIKLKGGLGGVRIYAVPESEIGPMVLGVSTDDGFYLLTLLEGLDYDVTVRSYWDNSKCGGGKKYKFMEITGLKNK